ncbi:dienelactone hydrolase endo-1,3,1,4-beta-D-glucanase [Polyporus arcularius HHB13444]|uniref:Dienelactone hydrolase endo-1,3,1,4-beta-D-glucanase n=2 Tax=Polyporaceae TaxID=5317 RepID=A0A5C3PT75_9APHY|nr:dienelactone hydrolase endo-1,3,1,4-beta-D-glucanase [Polyporus brumalis]TFK92601.1 dienelactone hydrolase endo-1,3,1,4-beta-D-glucanase [Polyporus arcularius HHB13444]
MPEFCDNCFKGVRHEGQPEGKIEKIGGVECYVATPTGDYPKDKVVLFLTDVFGIPLVNNKLLADDFARNGYRTVMPDILVGDALPEDVFTRTDFDREAWIARHGPDSWVPVVDAVVAALQAEGVTWIGTTGYCFGAPPAWHLALKGASKVTVVSHPSRLRVPEDLEEYRDKAKAPLLINSCEVDPQFGPDAQKIADELLGGGKFAPGYERTYWEGCTHGFAVRGDLSNPKVKAGKEGAFEATVKFYNKYKDL